MTLPSVRRIRAMTARLLRILFRASSRIVELAYEPLIPLLTWGLVLRSMGNSDLAIIAIIFSSSILWQLSYSIQSCFNLLTLEDIWHDCFKENLVTPLRFSEYLVSKVLATIVRSVLAAALMLSTAYFLFKFAPIALHLTKYLLIIGEIFLISIAVGLLIDAIIIHLGKETAFLAWSLNGVLIILSAPSYPVTAFPEVIRPFAVLSPYFFPFDQMKGLLLAGGFPTSSVLFSLASALCYGTLGILLLSLAIRNAKRNGNLAKL